MTHTMLYVAMASLCLAGCHPQAAADPHPISPSTAQTVQPAQTPQCAKSSSAPDAKQALAELDRLVTRAGVELHVDWSAEDQQKDIAIREISRNSSNSLHWVRARGAEKPHTHDTHDLVVVLLSGSVRAHLGDQIIEARAGDTLNIPKGLPHWVENTGEEPSLSLAVFSPPFDGKDRHFIGE